MQTWLILRHLVLRFASYFLFTGIPKMAQSVNKVLYVYIAPKAYGLLRAKSRPLIALNHQHDTYMYPFIRCCGKYAGGPSWMKAKLTKPVMFPAFRTRGGSLHHASLTAVLFVRTSTPCSRLLNAGRTNSVSIKVRVHNLDQTKETRT